MVIAGAATARVLGTSFAVRHYARTDTMTTVAVRDGKVGVGNVVVTAARLVEVASHGTSQLRSVDPSQVWFHRGCAQSQQHAPVTSSDGIGSLVCCGYSAGRFLVREDPDRRQFHRRIGV